jgi:hypothetical protein
LEQILRFAQDDKRFFFARFERSSARCCASKQKRCHPERGRKKPLVILSKAKDLITESKYLDADPSLRSGLQVIFLTSLSMPDSPFL